MRVLVVEDASFIRKALQAESFAVDVCHNGDDGLAAARATPYDAIVLDIMLPGRDGLSLLRQLREQQNAAPVLLLSARGEVNERVEGLDAGADDYLPKPFVLAELIARVRALGRRGGETKSPVLRVGELTLDTVTREARRGGVTIELTSREYRLLEFLMRSVGRICGRMAILEKVWDYDFDPGSNLVDVNVMRLREKIDADFEPKLLHTVRGIGYVMKDSPVSIRTRLTLWYAGIMFVSLVAMGILSYRAFAPEPQPARHSAGGPKPDESDESDLGEIFRILFWCGAPATLLALGGGWWMMRRALAPIAALTRAAERVNEHNLGEHLVRVGNGDELDRLTEVFNAMTERLNQSFARIREFTLHASHELKTPLTVMHGELETALQDQTLTGGQRERLESELDEVQRLAKIVDGLTLLTKADAGQITLARQPVRLDELVREACADAQSLARPHDIQVNLTACEELTVTGDRHRLRQLLLNLTDNAIKYNERRGVLTLNLRHVGERAEIALANTGPGISADILPRIFDPFFRGDPSHSQAPEGCGLGLSIARWITSAHGGTIEVTSGPNRLTLATVRLPLASQAQPRG